MNSNPTESPPAEAAPTHPNRVRIFFNGFALGILLTSGVAWYLAGQTSRHPEAQQRFQTATAQATDAAGEALYQAGIALKAKLDTLELNPDQIQEELARTGKVVRRRARELAARVADVAGDAATTAAIKARLAADRELSVWSVEVTTTDGRVVLRGTVAAPEHVARAIALAMEVDGVSEVASHLTVANPKS